MAEAELEVRLQRRLVECGASVATAESITGGRLAARLTGVAGASQTYLGGVVAYATEMKITVLGVPSLLVEQHGVVSAPCARAMAAGVRSLTGATYGVATTGVAGPTGQDGQPVGTLYVGIAGPERDLAVRFDLAGDRSSIQVAATLCALRALLDEVSPDARGPQLTG